MLQYRHWHRISKDSKACPLLSIIPMEKKSTVLNKLAYVNAKENLLHEMEILKQVT